MIKTPRQVAAGLLLTVLTMAAFATVSAVAIQLLLSSSRANGQIGAAQSADQMAQQGLQEGELRYRLHQLSVEGEYGVGAVSSFTSTTALSAVISGGYSLSAMRRGYLLGSSCANLASDGTPASTAYDPACTYYDLAVRTKAVIGRSSSPTAYNYPVNVFANGQVSLTFQSDNSGSVTFTLKQVAADGGTSDGHGLFTVSCSNCTNMGNPSVLATITLPTANPVALNIAYSGLISGQTPDTLQVASSTPLVFDKGFTTIDAIGYAGGIQKEWQANIYDKLSSPPPAVTILVSAPNHAFDQYGCVNASSPSSTCLTQ
jgi:hypothetical protein